MSDLGSYFEGFGCEAGVEGGCAGFAGCVFVVVGFTPDKTDPDEVEPEVRRTAKIESVIEVIMKIMAHQVVNRDKAVAVPRGPNAVWLPMPPNVAAISALLPCWSNTTTINTAQTKMCTTVIRAISISGSKAFPILVRKGGFEPPRLSAPPPQDGVSASSTTSALLVLRPSSGRQGTGKGAKREGTSIIANREPA